MKRSLLLLALVLVALDPRPAHADACTGTSPFLDIAPNQIFCTDAAWARNANVTNGCMPNLFCPDNPVSRGQMILFMRRLAVAIFPTVRALTESSDAPAGDLDGGGVNVCTSEPFALDAATNNHFVHAHAVVSLRANANADVQLVVSRSDNGGAFGVEHGVSQIVSVPAGQWATASVMIGYGDPLLPGSSYRWRIQLSRAPGSATVGELTDQRCQLKIHQQMDPAA